MKSYKTVNNLFGWLCFIVATVTYCLTVEPTASFWDCPEFITTAAKLEVGHPPGAPFFMLFGNLFAQFAKLNSNQKQAKQCGHYTQQPKDILNAQNVANITGANANLLKMKLTKNNK